MKVINFEDGHCKRIRSYLDSYLNNELMVETNHEVLAHLEKCEACSRSLEDRVRLKAQLKRAVMQEYAPAVLRERIVSDLRRGRGFSFNKMSLALAATAAVLVIAAVTFFAWSPPKHQLSLQAAVAPGDVNGQILKIGFDDHVFCAIDHNLANKQFTAEQMSEKLGPEYAGLVALLKDKSPQDYTVVVGHRCHYQGRERADRHEHPGCRVHNTLDLREPGDGAWFVMGRQLDAVQRLRAFSNRGRISKRVTPHESQDATNKDLNASTGGAGGRTCGGRAHP
jgi:anti-sigma factor (TIGR02949 family)